MKIILTQSVDGVGAAGDVVDVKPGYGRNFLIPSGVAVAWTAGGEKQAASIKRAQKAREIRGLDHAKEIKAQLESLAIVLTAKGGEKGKLFGSITSADVVLAVKQAGGPSLDKRALNLPGHVKTTGKFKVSVRLHPAVESTFVVDVVTA